MEETQTTLAQIIDGAMDPNWIMTMMLGVVGFLLIRILNRIEKKMDVHDMQLHDHDKRLTVIENDRE